MNPIDIMNAIIPQHSHIIIGGGNHESKSPVSQLGIFKSYQLRY